MTDAAKKTGISDDVAALLEAASGGLPAEALPNAAATAGKTRAQLQAIHDAEQELEDTLNSSDPSRLIGEEIRGRGIFLGRYEPKDRDGNSLGKTFNVFAMRQDLTDREGNKVFTYQDAINTLSQLNQEMGYGNRYIVNDASLYTALKDGSYDFEWVIPPKELLNGLDHSGERSQKDNLYTHRRKGHLRNSFITDESLSAAGNFFGTSYPYMYWSCTHTKFGQAGHGIGTSDFKHGDGSNYEPEFILSVRPVRFEQVKVTP
jgi:hypothetical protein